MRVPDNCSKLDDNINSGIDERLGNCEKFIGINKPVPRDIYKRLKNIEDQIFYLEGISPEYRSFLVIFFFLYSFVIEILNVIVIIIFIFHFNWF